GVRARDGFLCIRCGMDPIRQLNILRILTVRMLGINLLCLCGIPCPQPHVGSIVRQYGCKCSPPATSYHNRYFRVAHDSFLLKASENGPSWSPACFLCLEPASRY